MLFKTKHRAQLIRIAIPLALAWSLAWLIGIAALAKVALELRAELSQSDVDTQLALYATSTYGLTWFDATGAFHDEVFKLEPDLLNAPVDIWVVKPTAPQAVYLAPSRAQFALQDFAFLSAPVMQQQQKIYRDGVDANGSAYRLYAIPTYLDQAGNTTPKAMIVVVADPKPSQRAYQHFVRQLLLATLALGIVGLIVGVGLTRWSLQPVQASLQQRERFLSATAHELRTPIAALRSISESAQRGDEAPERALLRMQGPLAETQHTLENLLLFARLEAGLVLDRQPVRLDLLVESLLPEDSAIQLHATASVAQVDIRLASVAIRNLIANAQRYAGHDDSAISVIITGASVTVSDKGNGFPPEVLARQDEAFAIVHSVKGNGLGLAIVSMVARLHGGRLLLSNVSPQGAQAILQFST